MVITKKTWMISSVVLLLLGIVTVGVFAMPFNQGMGANNFKKDTAAQDALQKGDYAAYMTALENNWQAYKATITQDKFNTMAQEYQNMTAKRVAMQQTQAAITQAIKDGSYQEWTAATSGLDKKPAYMNNITADNFATYVQLYNAQQAKNWTAVQALAKELGINPMMRGNANGMGPAMHGTQPGNTSNMRPHMNGRKSGNTTNMMGPFIDGEQPEAPAVAQ